MASIPLVATTIRPIEQPDALQNFTRLQQLRGLQQEVQQRAQAAPYQQQILQQQAEAGQLENQQRQIAMKDQQAMTQAMQQWDGKSLDELPTLMIKHGASANAVMGMKQQILGTKEKYAALDATTLKTQTEKNGLIAGKLASLQQMPDDQLGQAITQGAQDLVSQGLLDPQHAQTAAQLAQLPPQQARQALENMRKGLLSDSQLLDDAQKQQAIDAKKQEQQFYAQNGGAPGVPTEAVQQADWLKKNPGKGPSDYKLWTLRNSPSAMILGNQLGGGGNSDALDFAAENYRQTGQLPSGFTRSPGTTAAIISRAAQLDQQAGGAGIYANKTILNSYKGSLDQLQKNLSAVSAFEDTANKNIDMLKQVAAKVPDLGVRFANTPIRAISGSIIGTENMAAFKTALAPVQAEAAKILNSANLTGQLSDTARKELQDIVDGNATYPALVASLNVLQQDFKNRHTSYQSAISDLQDKIKNAGTTGTNNSGGSQNQGGNDPFAQFGGKAH